MGPAGFSFCHFGRRYLLLHAFDLPSGEGRSSFARCYQAIDPRKGERVVADFIRSEPWSLGRLCTGLERLGACASTHPERLMDLVSSRIVGPMSSLLLFEDVTPRLARPAVARDIVDLASLATAEVWTWVELELRGKSGERYPGASIRIQRPTGSARTETLGPDSRLRLEGLLDHGTCRVELLELGQPEEAEDLLEAEAMPIVLGGPPIAVATGRVHTLTVQHDILHLRVRGLKPYVEAFGSIPCSVTFGGTTHERVLQEEDQELVFAISPTLRGGVFTLMGTHAIAFSLGSLASTEEDEGVRHRLVNLGFAGRAPEPTINDTFTDLVRAALASFQRRLGLDPTGDLDGHTQAELEDHYAGAKGSLADAPRNGSNTP